jgi:hypothetical protein
MKMPVNCPICGGILLNEYTDQPSKYVRFIKICSKRINHNIQWEALDNSHDELYKIYVLLNNKPVGEWNVIYKYINVYTPKGELRIPYFEPDFSNYKRLIEKIKTYIVFS